MIKSLNYICSNNGQKKIDMKYLKGYIYLKYIKGKIHWFIDYSNAEKEEDKYV